MIVAVTGYIGAGKTTVAQIFSEYDYSVIEADVLGHDLLRVTEVKEKIKEKFGMNVMDRELQIDRGKLSKIVFNNEVMLKDLNEIMHPYLISAIETRAAEVKGDMVIDAALYHELEIDKLADVSILVTADVENIYERLSPAYTKKEVLNVMNSQKIIRSPDYTIENNDSHESLRSKVVNLIKKLGEM